MSRLYQSRQYISRPGPSHDGRGDKVHRDWINSQGLSYAELLGMQMRSFGGEGFHKLANLLEKTSKVDEKDIKMTSKGGTARTVKANADEGEQQSGEV